MSHGILNVYFGRELVGELEQDASGITRFQYTQSWINSPDAVPISASLPLRSERFSRNETRPFFAGVLPEEESRMLIAKMFGVSERNDFELLARIGAECAGAVSLLSLGESPAEADPQYLEISLAQIGDKLAELPRRPLMAGDQGVRLSLAGAQGKIALKLENERFFLSLDGAPSSHILKPENPRFAGLVKNEYFCMRLASEVGLEAASVEIGTAGEIPFLQVKRYDRRMLADGRLERIHQEDFCQALGIPPDLKYQQEGGPGLKQCFELIRSVSTVPGPDLLRLFDGVVFNVLIGNRDAHGKNFSILRENHSIRMAPFYDLMSTQVYPGLAAEMAMKIGGERNAKKINAKNWHLFFEDAAIGQAVAQQRLLFLNGRILAAAKTLFEKGCPGAESVFPVVKENAEQLAQLRW